MRIRELIAILNKLPKNMDVVMSADAEGNHHSPLANVYIGYYTPETSWNGEFHSEEVMNDDDINNLKAGSYKAICLSPTN